MKPTIQRGIPPARKRRPTAATAPQRPTAPPKGAEDGRTAENGAQGLDGWPTANMRDVDRVEVARRHGFYPAEPIEIAALLTAIAVAGCRPDDQPGTLQGLTRQIWQELSRIDALAARLAFSAVVNDGAEIDVVIALAELLAGHTNPRLNER